MNKKKAYIGALKKKDCNYVEHTGDYILSLGT